MVKQNNDICTELLAAHAPEQELKVRKNISTSEKGVRYTATVNPERETVVFQVDGCIICNGDKCDKLVLSKIQLIRRRGSVILSNWNIPMWNTPSTSSKLPYDIPCSSTPRWPGNMQGSLRPDFLPITVIHPLRGRVKDLLINTNVTLKDLNRINRTAFNYRRKTIVLPRPKYFGRGYLSSIDQ